MKRINQFFSKVKTDLVEYWTGAMIVIGLPLVAYLYVDWRLALGVFIAVNIIIGIIYLRKG